MRRSAMRRSPSGVAMGVSGDAQTNWWQEQSWTHSQTPSAHQTDSPHRPPHELAAHLVPDGSEQGVPAFGTWDGQGADGA